MSRQTTIKQCLPTGQSNEQTALAAELQHKFCSHLKCGSPKPLSQDDGLYSMLKLVGLGTVTMIILVYYLMLCLWKRYVRASVPARRWRLLTSNGVPATQGDLDHQRSAAIVECAASSSLAVPRATKGQGLLADMESRERGTGHGRWCRWSTRDLGLVTGRQTEQGQCRVDGSGQRQIEWRRRLDGVEWRQHEVELHTTRGREQGRERAGPIQVRAGRGEQERVKERERAMAGVRQRGRST